MTDAQLRALLVELRRNNDNPRMAARALEFEIDMNPALIPLLCRYVIDRMVPMKGAVG